MGDLYKRSYLGPFLLCVHLTLVKNVLFEIHKGICGLHFRGYIIGPPSPNSRVLVAFRAKRCLSVRLQMYKVLALLFLIHLLARDLTSLTSPWPFAQSRMDIGGILPRASGNKKLLLAAIDYFTKWVEAEQLVQIIELDVIRFICRNILSRLGILRAFVSDNETQFVG